MSDTQLVSLPQLPPMIMDFLPKPNKLSVMVLDVGATWSMVQEMCNDLLRYCPDETALITVEFTTLEELNIPHVTTKLAEPLFVIIYNTADIPAAVEAAADSVLFGKLVEPGTVALMTIK